MERRRRERCGVLGICIKGSGSDKRMGSVAVHDHDRAGSILTMRTNPTLANGVPTNNGASPTI